MNNMECDVCKSSKWAKFLNKLIVCQKCGLIRANFIYSNKELYKLYEHDYYFGKEYANYLGDRKALEINFRARIKYLQDKNYLNKNTSVIEIGSAYGFFLNLIKTKCKTSVGYDITREGVDYARKKLKVNAIYGDFIKQKRHTADLICMWDVIEHLGEPAKYVSKISESLNKNGVLVLTTGDIGSLMARIQGERWRMIHPPTHMFYFNQKTIKQILKNYDLEVVDIKYNPIFRNAGSIAKQLWGLSDVRVNKILSRINFKINLFDIMEVYAIRR